LEVAGAGKGTAQKKNSASRDDAFGKKKCKKGEKKKKSVWKPESRSVRNLYLRAKKKAYAGQ